MPESSIACARACRSERFVIDKQGLDDCTILVKPNAVDFIREARAVRPACTVGPHRACPDLRRLAPPICLRPCPQELRKHKDSITYVAPVERKF